MKAALLNLVMTDWPVVAVRIAADGNSVAALSAFGEERHLCTYALSPGGGIGELLSSAKLSASGTISADRRAHRVGLDVAIVAHLWRQEIVVSAHDRETTILSLPDLQTLATIPCALCTNDSVATVPPRSALSPSGDRLLLPYLDLRRGTWSFDGETHLTSALHQATQIRTRAGLQHTGFLPASDFPPVAHPEGRLVATAYVEDNGYEWGVRFSTVEPFVRTYAQSASVPYSVRSIAFNHTGSQFAVFSFDHWLRIRLYSFPSCELIGECQFANPTVGYDCLAEEYWPERVVFSPKGSRLLAPAPNGALYAFSAIDEFAPHIVLDTLCGIATSVDAHSASGLVVATSSEGELAAWFVTDEDADTVPTESFTERYIASTNAVEFALSE